MDWKVYEGGGFTLGEMTSEKEFNLLHEPWILVKDKENNVQKLSILETFKQAHNFQQLAGEALTQDIAVLRLLLAIMHAAFVNENINSPEMAKKMWKWMWDKKCFDEECYHILEEYLRPYEDRFWLFHPETPFYQVANLPKIMNDYKRSKGIKVKAVEDKRKDGDGSKKVARLIGNLFQSGNTYRLFANRLGTEKEQLYFDEAARWLLHLNAFDDDAAKKPTPKGVGYLGKLGLVFISGKNLYETLMLNFVLLDDRNELFEDFLPSEKAYWEKPVCTKIENEIPQPNAQKDLLTMQSRRILLKKENAMVVGYWLTMGDYFSDEGGLLNEQMTEWEYWKKGEATGIKPKIHSPAKQMWRDLEALLVQDVASNKRLPGVVNWVRVLIDTFGNFTSKYLQIGITGIHYVNKSAGWQVDDFINDSVTINIDVLEKLNKDWIIVIINALSSVDGAVANLGYLANEIDEASGNSNYKNKMAGNVVKERCYNMLDNLFRSWLMSINPRVDQIEEKKAELFREVKKIILLEGERLLENCSEQALTGIDKSVDDRKNEKINAFKSFSTFMYNVNKKLG